MIENAAWLGSQRQSPSPTVPHEGPRFELAVAACREARFADALALLRREADGAEPAALLLYARILMRNNPTEASGMLAGKLTSLVRPDHRLEAAILLGTAQARVGDYKGAHARFDRVRDSLSSGAEAPLALADEVAYRDAWTLWMERKLQPAESALKMVVANPSSEFFVEALILEGAVSAARGRFEQQAATLLKALRAVLAAERRDVLHWAHVTAQLSYLAREMPSPSLRDAVIDNIDAVPWTADIADLHFTALKAVGWRHALEGDYLSAFRYLKRASRVAPTEAWKVMAICDRALLAQSLGERRFTEQELDDVREIADRIDWRSIAGEERLALLILAVLHAPTDGALALSFVARFQETGSSFDRLLSANGDRRLQAFIDYSLGYVYARLNYREEALASLEDAWKTFDGIGYDWRAARCANEIASFTNDAAWSARAKEKIAAYPRSWIASEIDAASMTIHNDAAASAERHLSRNGRDALLTPAQREVYRLLMDGVAVSEIATLSKRSEFTIRNHIKAIFKAFHVNSRAALMRARPEHD